MKGHAVRRSRRTGSSRWLWLLAAGLVPPIAINLFFGFQPWIPFEELAGDPLILAKDCIGQSGSLDAAERCIQPHFGFLSNLGVVIWAGVAVICGFSGIFLLRQTGSVGGFLLSAGLLSAILMFDDLLLGHEWIYPRLFGFGESTTFLVYAVLFLLHCGVYCRVILALEGWVLALGALFFGLSLAVDLDVIDLDHVRALHDLIEDGAKFVAIWLWGVFHTHAAWQLLRGKGYSAAYDHAADRRDFATAIRR